MSLSGVIHPTSLPADLDNAFTVYEITLADVGPNTGFLRQREDLEAFRHTYRGFLAQLRGSHPGLGEVHVFPAVPAPVAIVCGFDLLPKVDPTLVVYDNVVKDGGFIERLRINDHELNTVISGTSISQVRDDIYLIDLIARATEEQRILSGDAQISADSASQRAHRPSEPIRNIRICPGLPGGLATRPHPNPDRAGRCRAGSAAGDGDQGACSGSRWLRSRRCRGPTRSLWAVQWKRAQKSQASVLAVVPVMVLLMLTVLMFQLQSFQRLALVLSVAPLGLIGVVGGTASVGAAAGLRRNPGNSGAVRHDHEECGDPDRPDRGGKGSGKKRLGSCYRCQQLSVPAHHAYSGVDGAWHDTDCPDRVLGTDGLRDHGWTAGRDHPHPRFPADARMSRGSKGEVSADAGKEWSPLARSC